MARHLLVSRIPHLLFTLSKQIGLTREDDRPEPAGRQRVVIATSGSETAMHKILEPLDEEQREALAVLIDFGTAVCLAGFVVAVLEGTVEFVARFI